MAIITVGQESVLPYSAWPALHTHTGGTARGRVASEASNGGDQGEPVRPRISRERREISKQNVLTEWRSVLSDPGVWSPPGKGAGEKGDGLDRKQNA